MRRRLLVGMGVVTLALVSVLVTLSPAGAAGPGRHPGGTLRGPALEAPVSGGCIPGTEQCSPVVPQPTGGPSPAVALTAAMVTITGTLVGRARLRRRRHTYPLPSGFLATILHPPRVLGTI